MSKKKRRKKGHSSAGNQNAPQDQHSAGGSGGQQQQQTGALAEIIKNAPVYCEYRKAARRVAHSDVPNPGLVYDRLFDVPMLKYQGRDMVGSERQQVSAHYRFLTALLELFKQQSNTTKAALNGVLQRQDALLQALGDGRYRIGQFSAQWRFVSGLGKSHALETGFVWDRNLGIPYLPGSSVKGVVRAYADMLLPKDRSAQSRPQESQASGSPGTNDRLENGEGGREAPSRKDIARIFGPEDKDKHASGTVIFFDAYPVEPPPLEVDIMNPHYSEYYSNPGKTPPADWLSPTPIFFLTVAPGAKFRFAIALRPGTSDRHQTDLELAWQWLQGALEYLGAGAKTAVGYGYFDNSDSGTQ